MKTTAIALALCMICGAGLAFAQEAEQPARRAPAEAESPQNPIEAFHEARENLLKVEQDREDAAEDVRGAAAYLRREVQNASAQAKPELLASANELDQLAARIESNALVDVNEMNPIFARAHFALAQDFNERAKQSWLKKDAKRTGEAMRSAAAHTANALAWTGGKVERGAVETVRGTRLLAGKMIEGTGWSEAEVGKGIDRMGDAIQTVGKKIEPRKR